MFGSKEYKRSLLISTGLHILAFGLLIVVTTQTGVLNMSGDPDGDTLVLVKLGDDGDAAPGDGGGGGEDSSGGEDSAEAQERPQEPVETGPVQVREVTPPARTPEPVKPAPAPVRATPAPTPAPPKPTATPVPEVKKQAEVPKPTATPKPTSTPKPTATPKPEKKPDPTPAPKKEEPKPKKTPAPTATPTPRPATVLTPDRKAQMANAPKTSKPQPAAKSGSAALSPSAARSMRPVPVVKTGGGGGSSSAAHTAPGGTGSGSKPGTAGKPWGSSMGTAEEGGSVLKGQGLPDYYAKQSLAKLARFFQLPPGKATDATAMVKFRIQRDGTLTDIRIARSAGSDELDEFALRAVRTAKSFSPFPDDFEKDSVEVEVSFSYKDA